ncbi:hypothetical protein [Solibaculum mannosilyticum]
MIAYFFLTSKMGHCIGGKLCYNRRKKDMGSLVVYETVVLSHTRMAQNQE